MQVPYLQLLNFLGNYGYYARTESEKNILTELLNQGYVQIKLGTKSVYNITKEGKNFLNKELNPNTEITDQEFLKFLKEAYKDLSNPMNPLVKIPDLKRKLTTKRIPDEFFNKKVLEFHDQGILTLQTALSKKHAVHGGIESDSGTGVFYYLLFEV